jgi:hypothetical protein
VRFGETFVKFEVTEAQPNSRYVWHVEDCYLHWLENKTEWKGTDVIFAISPSTDGCKLEMTHRGLNPSSECYNDCRSGWEHFVTASLAKLIVEGAGSPEGQEVSA